MLISLVNLLAAAIQPQCPSMFIVLYQPADPATQAVQTAHQQLVPQIGGEVGDTTENLDHLIRPIRNELPVSNNHNDY